MDPKECKSIIRTSSISKFQPYHKHQVLSFSTLYTTIPHQKLKSRLATIIRNSYIHKNGNRRYTFLVLGREGPYIVKDHSDSKNKYTEDDIIKGWSRVGARTGTLKNPTKFLWRWEPDRRSNFFFSPPAHLCAVTYMTAISLIVTLNNQFNSTQLNVLEFLVDNIFVVFGGKVFQQIVGIPIGTNCAPLLADIFLYSYEAEFIQSLLSTGKKKLASQFNFTYRYIDDVLSINNL